MDHAVFVNRVLNMKKIKYIGLDMDHTLIRYHTKEFESLVYTFLVKELVNMGYPVKIQELQFHFSDAIRGLIIDKKNGNILKLSRYGTIRLSYHGTKLIDFSEQKKFYRSVHVDLNNPNYVAVDTSFSIALCVLYGQLVDLRDNSPIDYPAYSSIAEDVLKSMDNVHSHGFLKKQVSQNLDRFIIKEPELISQLQFFVECGKKLFILTNSEYYYTKLLLDYAINPFLDKGKTWQDLFPIVIVGANKPRFFYDNLPFLSIDPNIGTMTNVIGPIGSGVYQGGNANQFTEDLELPGDEILYIGDHVYGDILRLKKDCNWRTALVVEELGSEIQSQIKAKPIEQDITKNMLKKCALEDLYLEIQTKAIKEKTHKYATEIQELQKQISDFDLIISGLIKKQQSFYNHKWERVFRAGAEESYFAYQVDRYACIYMEKLSDLFAHSPFTYFRANRRMLAHDQV